MKRELSAKLKKGSLSGIEAGMMLLLSTIHRVNHHADKDYKPLLTDKEKERIIYLARNDEGDRRALETYNILRETLVSLVNTSITKMQQAYHGQFRTLMEMARVDEGIHTSMCLDSLPLPITEKEFQTCSAKSARMICKQQIPIVEALLHDIGIIVSDYRKRNRGKGKYPEVEKRLDAEVKNERLLALPFFSDWITEGGIRFGSLHGDMQEPLIEEARKNLRTAYKAKTDMDVIRELYKRSQGILQRLCKETDAVLDEVNKDADRAFLLQAFTMAVWKSLTASSNPVTLHPTESDAQESLTQLLSDYAQAVANYSKNELVIQSLDYIFGVSPLQVKRLPYKKELTVYLILKDASEAFSGSLENFDEVLGYLDGLEPIFERSEDGKKLLERIRSEEVRKNFAESKSIRALVKEGSLIGTAFIREADAPKRIVSMFKELYPKDPRCVYKGHTYAIAQENADALREGFLTAQQMEVDTIAEAPNRISLVSGAIKNLIRPSCVFMTASRRFLKDLAEIYKMPELTTTIISAWDKENICIDGMNALLARELALIQVGSTEAQEKKRRETLMRAFSPLTLNQLYPDEEVYSLIIRDVASDPFGDKTRFTLERLVTIIEMLSNEDALQAFKEALFNG